MPHCASALASKNVVFSVGNFRFHLFSRGSFARLFLERNGARITIDGWKYIGSGNYCKLIAYIDYFTERLAWQSTSSLCRAYSKDSLNIVLLVVYIRIHILYSRKILSRFLYLESIRYTRAFASCRANELWIFIKYLLAKNIIWSEWRK